MSDPTPAEEAAAADAMLDSQIADHMQQKEDERRAIYPDHLRNDDDEPPDDDEEQGDIMPPKDEKTSTTTTPKRNWSNATLLARLADVLAFYLSETDAATPATKAEIVRDPKGTLPADMTAIEVIDLLKDRVIEDTMAERA